MAIFKILRGKEVDIPQLKNDGYCYYCIDTGNYYIDYLDRDSNEVVRGKISVGCADSLKYIEDGEYKELTGKDIEDELNRIKRQQYYGDADIEPTSQNHFRITIIDETSCSIALDKAYIDSVVVIPYECIVDNICYSVTRIEFEAFVGCINLMSVIIPNSITYISDAAFQGCYSLRNITIPNGTIYIGAKAFYECNALTIKCCPGSVAEQHAKNNNIPYEYINKDSIPVAIADNIDRINIEIQQINTDIDDIAEDLNSKIDKTDGDNRYLPLGIASGTTAQTQMAINGNAKSLKIYGAADGVGDLVTDETDEHFGKYKIPVKVVYGKNLFDIDAVRLSAGTFTKTETGFVINTATAQTDIKCVTLQPGIYTLHVDTYRDGQPCTNEKFIKPGDTSYVTRGFNPITFSFNAESELWIRCFNMTGIEYRNVMLVKGAYTSDNMPEYQPYIQPQIYNTYLDKPISENKSHSVEETIELHSGINKISLDTTIQPSNMELEYYQNPTEVINELIKTNLSPKEIETVTEGNILVISGTVKEIPTLTGAVTITLGEPINGYDNEWCFTITQGETAYTIGLPIIEWILGIAPTFSANTTTEVRLHYKGDTLEGVWN